VFFVEILEKKLQMNDEGLLEISKERDFLTPSKRMIELM